MSTDTWQRIYFTEPYKSPHIFYALFGTDNINELSVSKSRHNVDIIPDELEIKNCCKTENQDQKDYIEQFYAGFLGEILKEKDATLYEKVINCNNVVVIKGEFPDSATLDYLRNTVGIIQAINETGITAILDLHMLNWYEPADWSTQFFAPRAPEVFRHVQILYSVESDGTWLHTHGMIKFGRPDISIKKIATDKVELAIEIVNRFIQVFANGLIPDENKGIRLRDMENEVYGKILGDYNNPDFNNYYFEIEGI